MNEADRTIRVTVPAHVIYDFDKATQVLKKTLEQLGCGACCSGHDIRFEVARRFVADDNLKITVEK